MEKLEKNTIKKTKENEIVELKDEDLKTVTAGSENGSGSHKKGCIENSPEFQFIACEE